MATSLTSFLPLVLPHAPGCPDVAAKDAILRAAIKFCESTRAWKAKLTAVDIVANTADYAVTLPTGGQLVILDRVYFDGRQLEPKTLDQLDEIYTNWNTRSGTPIYYTHIDPDTITLVPNPDVALTDGLVMHGSFSPSRTATTVQDFLYNSHADDIANGAIVELCSTPGKPWTNAEAAGYRASLFQQAIDATKARIAKSNTRAANRTKPRFF